MYVGTSGRTCCVLSPRTLCKRVVVNNLSRTDEVGIGCSLLGGQLEDTQDGPVLRILVLIYTSCQPWSVNGN
jgi:hypothetical protein